MKNILSKGDLNQSYQIARKNQSLKVIWNFISIDITEKINKMSNWMIFRTFQRMLEWIMLAEHKIQIPKRKISTAFQSTKQWVVWCEVKIVVLLLKDKIVHLETGA